MRELAHTLTLGLEPLLALQYLKEIADASDAWSSSTSLDAIEWKRTHPADDLLTALHRGRGRRRPPLPRRAARPGDPAVHRRPRDDRQPHRQRHARAAAPPRPARTRGATTRRSTPTRSTSCCATTRRCSSRVASRTADLEFGGQTIEAGVFVLTCLASANRDPAHWGDDADALDVSARRCGPAPRVRRRASTTASVRRWPGSRAAWPSARSSGAFPGARAGHRRPGLERPPGAPGPRLPARQPREPCGGIVARATRLSGGVAHPEPPEAAMPAVTVDNPLVLPRIARPDAADHRGAARAAHRARAPRDRGCRLRGVAPVPGRPEHARHRPVPPPRPARAGGVRTERGGGRAVAPAPRLRDRHLRARR